MRYLIIAALAVSTVLATEPWTARLATNVTQRPSGPPQHTTNGVVRTLVTVTNIVLLVDYKGTQRTLVLEQVGGAQQRTLPGRVARTNVARPHP